MEEVSGGTAGDDALVGDLLQRAEAELLEAVEEASHGATANPGWIDLKVEGALKLIGQARDALATPARAEPPRCGHEFVWDDDGAQKRWTDCSLPRGHADPHCNTDALRDLSRAEPPEELREIRRVLNAGVEARSIATLTAAVHRAIEIASDAASLGALYTSFTEPESCCVTGGANCTAQSPCPCCEARTRAPVDTGPRHVCGLHGYNPMKDPPCPACRAP